MLKSNNKEPHLYSNQKHISFLTLTYNVVQAAKVPTYRTKFSKHEFTQPQLLTLLVFKEYLGVKYRELYALFEIMEDIKPILGVSRLPHFTTLCKFSHRIGSRAICRVLQKITSLFYRSRGRISIIAIDSTGFPSSYFSYYYSIRANKDRKGFLKLSIAIDTRKLTILAIKVTRNRQHDTKHAKTLLRSASRIKLADYYVLDKGYDSEEMHRQVRVDLKAIAYIPLRDWHAGYVGGKFRQEMSINFNKTIYGKRNLVETVFSVIKRRFGGFVKSHKYTTQVKEIKLKCIAYTAERFLKEQRTLCLD